MTSMNVTHMALIFGINASVSRWDLASTISLMKIKILIRFKKLKRPPEVIFSFNLKMALIRLITT